MMSKEVVLPAGEVKKARRRRRRAGARAAKKRERKSASAVATGLTLAPPEVTSPIKCAVHTFLLRYQSALRRIPSHLPPRVHAGPPSKRVKRVSWCHEDGGVSSGGGGGGGGDPAVLALGPSRRALTYTREELMRLRHSPLVKKGLEDAFAGCEALALVLKKRSDSPNEEDRGGRGDAPSENLKGVFGRERDRERRSADPRERVRKESEPSGGIVLSPQRRSFTSGCGAPAAAAAPPPHVARTRPDSPLSNAAPLSAKPEPGGRRIGSGRIMVRDEPNDGRDGGRSVGTGRGGGERQGGWEREDEYRPEPYRPPPQQRLNGDRFERRSFGRDNFTSDIKREREDRFNNEKMRDREDNRRSGGRYSNRRFDKDDEPEWFSGGPTSQHDTIELCGLEEHEKKKSMLKNGNANNKETDKWNTSNPSKSPAPERWRETSSPVAPPNDSPNSSNDKDSGVDSKTEEPQPNNENEFNLDDFLKLDAIPDVLTNGGGETEGSSRFSQWFRRESPTNDMHYERILHNMVDELDNSTRLEPPPVTSEAQHVFAPISPARPHPPSLMDLLLRANEPRPQDAGGSAGKVHSLEELEARLRPQQPQHHAVPDHDLTAFKRLLAQVSGGHAVTAEPARAQPPPQPHQPMSLLQMLNKSMEQQQQQKVQQQPPVIPPDLVYKLLHVQQRQQQTEQLNAQLGPDRELLQRPEAQAILHGLKSGEITAQHLMQQLGNPGLQSRHREMLMTILRMQQQHHQRQMQGGGSPLPMGGAPVPPHLVVPPHHQPLRLSPLPHQAVHTQSIMQSALIKKKLEEQRENYNRRRQEILHQPKQPTPISFTPTSVLRKMTAEKESDAPSPKQQWNQPPKMPQMGRPIVKGNQSGVPTMGYAPSPAEYQQHYMNQQQQQMINNIRPFPHPPQRQQPQPANNFNNMNNMGRSMPGNTTLHQLLAQSHQRSLNDLISEMGNVGAGGGDNQLARWFSPELLARASAGKLPSVHVPNALSLEDLERHHHSPAPVVRN